MSGDNLVSIQIPPELLTQIKAKVNELKESLSPYLIALSGKEIRGLFKMNDGTIPFAEKCLNYAKTNPKFLPPYVDVQEMEVDFNAVKDLSEIYRPLKELITNLGNTITQAGSETLAPSLAYYNSVKQAAKQNIPDAKTIYDELKKRFEKNGGNSEPAQPKT